VITRFWQLGEEAGVQGRRGKGAGGRVQGGV